MEWTTAQFFFAYLFISGACGLLLFTSINMFFRTQTTIDSPNLFVQIICKYFLFSLAYFFSVVIISPIILGSLKGMLLTLQWYSEHKKIAYPIFSVLPALFLLKLSLWVLRWADARKAKRLKRLGIEHR